MVRSSVANGLARRGTIRVCPLHRSERPPAPRPIRLTASRLPSFAATDTAPLSPVLALLRHDPVDGLLPLPLLAGPRFDRWHSSRPLQRGQLGEVQWVDDGETLFLQLSLSDHDWQRDPAATTERAYRALEAARLACGAPHWWRLWNYLGGIVEGEGDAERYRLFTLGRHRAWADAALPMLPAATAIGCAQGLHIFALAGRLPVLPVENPRQLSAWRYPRAYGVQPPSFARAALVREGAAGWLFVSGTASIVGHESRHVGDLAAQFAEARTNLDAVVSAAAAVVGCDPRGFVPRNFKLYWTHAAAAREHAALADALQRLAPTQVLQGTVCRRELGVEIEALYALDAGRTGA